MKMKCGAVAATVWKYKWRAEIVMYLHCDCLSNTVYEVREMN